MKSQLNKLISTLGLCALLVFPAAVVSTTGCTLTQQQTAVQVEYKTLSSVINVVDLSRGVYDELYKAGKVPQDLDDKVAIIYKEYQRVGNLAILVARNQAAAANAGGTVTDHTNIWIPQLQTLINQLLELFGQAPGMPKQPPVTLPPGPGI